MCVAYLVGSCIGLMTQAEIVYVDAMSREKTLLDNCGSVILHGRK